MARKAWEDDYDRDSPTLLDEVLTYKSKTRRLFSPWTTSSDSSGSIESYGSIESPGSSSGSWNLDDLIKDAAVSSTSSSEASAILKSLEHSDDEEEELAITKAPEKALTVVKQASSGPEARKSEANDA